MQRWRVVDPVADRRSPVTTREAIAHLRKRLLVLAADDCEAVATLMDHAKHLEDAIDLLHSAHASVMRNVPDPAVMRRSTW